MKWLKKNQIKVLVILIHSLVLARLLLGAYAVDLTEPFGFIVPVLRIAVPAALIGIGITGLIRDLRAVYLLLVLIGGVFLWQTFTYDPERIVDAIRLINDKLSASRALVYEDFSFLIENITLIVVVLSFLTIYVYPWNLLIMDLSFLFFLWAVDSLPDRESLLVPLVYLWGFLFVHDRIISRDADFSEFQINRVDKRSRLLQGLVLSLIISAITINLVGQTKGPLYDDVWMKANDYLMQDDFLSGDYFMDSFSLSSTGYQDSSTSLGGDVSLNNYIALRAVGDVPTYLRGNTKRVYTGSIWEKSDLIYRTDNNASQLTTQTYKDAPVHQMTVDPAGVETSSLFVPIYPRSVTLEQTRRDKRVYYSIQDQTFMAADPQKDNYTVNFYDQAYVEALALEGIDDRYTRDHEPYLRVPSTITQRTVDLVTDIIADQTGQGEKILAITTYLRDHYEYTLTPGDPPAGQDFVDHFLFEAEEGYCVYYATALTVMLRIAGIPARYAEGFKVSDETDSEGFRIIRNSDAHAWTEVLTDPRQDLWTIWDATGTPRDFDAMGENGGSTPIPSTRPGPEVTTPVRTLPEDTLPDGLPSPGEGPDGGEDFRDLEIPGWLWGILLAALLAAGIVLLKRSRIKRLMEADDAERYLKYIISLLEESGLEIRDSDTLFDITRQIEDEETQKQFRRFALAHYRARYGQQPLKMGTAQRRDLLDEVYRIHRMSNPKIRHWLRRFVI